MKLFKKLIPWIIVLLLLGLLVQFVIIPLYTKEDTGTPEKPVVSYYEGGEKHLTLDNDFLFFDFDPMTTHFTVTDKSNGAVWYSNPPDAANDSVALGSNKEVLQSTLLMDYATKNSKSSFNNYKNSIENQSYTVIPTENGIRVIYGIGKIEKIYCIPTAITVDRYNAFLDAMGSKNAKKVKDNYTLYSLEKLEGKDNKDEILSKYPEIENQPLYVLKADVKENNKKKIEGYFSEGGYTLEDYETDMLLVAGASEAKGAIFNVTVDYRLEGHDLIVEIPYDQIRYFSNYYVTALTVLPMFGAAGTDEDGFMLIPEGGGALIYNNNGKLTQNSYYSNLYGWDYAVQRSEVVSETRSDFPVFGMSKGGNSFLCIIEGAASYAGIQADISNRYNSYNWLCAKFTVMHTDQYNVSAKTEQLVLMPEKQMPQDSIVQRYRFIASDSYVDMAKAYGDYLSESNPAYAEKTASEDVPVSVEIVGAINKTVETAGLPVDRVIAATTFEQAGEIMDDLTAAAEGNLTFRMTGWANGGIWQQVLTDVDPVSSMGGEKGLRALIKKSCNADIPFYFDGITCFAYDSDLLDGFTPFRDAARYTTRAQVGMYPIDTITYQPSEWLEDQYYYYLVKPSYAEELAGNLIEYLKKEQASGVAFRDIGKLLSADYNRNSTVTREQVVQMNINTMREAAAAGLKVMIKEGNDYALPYCDIVTDMDFIGRSYSIIDTAVPFYQIAIHGKVDYTGQAINISSDFRTELLHCAEYGAGLNFCFMAQDAKILQDTVYSEYHAAYYGNWKDSVGAIISRYQEEMKGLNRLRIISHTCPANGITVTGYEDGTAVYVNYTEKDFEYEGLTIPAQDYLVERGTDA